ncbi:MAG: PAS domain S-box protein [Desulfovermiculus sp.]
MSALGAYISKCRTALQEKHQGYSIRCLAQRLGIHHSYLSKLERGEHAPLSERRILALARELGEDPEVLLALSGRLSQRLVRIIKHDPGHFLNCLSAVENLTGQQGLEVDGYALRLAQRKGELEELIRFMRDEVQEHKRAQVRLEQKETELLTILDNLKDSVVISLDSHMNIQWISSSIGLDFWQSKDQVLGRKCYEAFYAQSKPCPGCTVSKAIDTRNACEDSSLHTWAGQSWLMRSIPIRNQKGQVYRVVRFGFDVTELEKTRQNAEQSERRWKFALEGAQQGVWDWHIPSGKVFYSRRWKKMLGYAEHEIGDNISEWKTRIHPDDYARAMDALNRHLNGESEFYSCEHRLQAKDRGSRWILDRGMVLDRDEQGAPVRAFGTHLDITESKKNTERLRQNEHKYHMLYDKSPAMLHSVDPQGRIIEVNDLWLKKMEYIREEVVGKPSVDFLTPHSRDKALKKIIPVFRAQGEVHNVTYQMRSKNGDLLDVLLSAVAEYDAAGRMTQSLCVITDISEQRHAEKALHQSNERYWAVEKDTLALICRFQPDGTISYVNKAFCECFGQDKAELAGSNVEDLIPKHEQQAARKRIISLTPEEPVASHHLQVKLPDGRVRWQRWTDRALFDVQGQIEAYQSIGIDVTDVEMAQKQLQTKIKEQNILLDSIPVHIWYLTDTKTYGRVNQAHADFLGLPRDCLESKPLEQFLPLDVATMCQESNHMVFARRMPVNTKQWVPNKQGHLRLLDITKTPHLNDLGEIAHVVCWAIDITDGPRS